MERIPTTVLSESNILAFYDSGIDFAIDLDRVWRWLGYGSKQSCLNKLKKNFVEGRDFMHLHENLSGSQGRPVHKYFLTIECFKTLSICVGTSQGLKVRDYFLKCEESLRRRIEAEKSPPPDPIVTAIESISGLLIQASKSLGRINELEQQLQLQRQELDRMHLAARSAAKEAAALPPAKVDVPQLSTRVLVGRLVRAFAIKNYSSEPNSTPPYDQMWDRLFMNFRDTYHIDPKRISANLSEKEGKKISPLDVVEREGKIEELYAIARRLFASGNLPEVNEYDYPDSGES